MAVSPSLPEKSPPERAGSAAFSRPSGAPSPLWMPSASSPADTSFGAALLTPIRTKRVHPLPQSTARLASRRPELYVETLHATSPRHATSPTPRSTKLLQDGQILLYLVGRHLNAVFLELRPLQLKEPGEDVLSQALVQELRVLGLLDGLAEVGGQALDAELLPLFVREMVEVALHRLGQLVALLDTLEARVQQRREAQVDVRRGVRAPELGAGGLLLARVVERNPYQRRAVAPAPGDVDRGFVAGDQPLVGVHELGEDDADLPRVPELARDELLRRVGEVVLVVRVEEGVAIAREEALMGVHPRAVLVYDRLGHERGVDPVLGGYLLDDRLVGHHLVGHLQGAVEAQVYLVLADADLVVRVLYVDAELLQRHDRLAPQAGRRIQRRQVEVAAVVQGFGAGGVPEVEVLELRPAEEVIEAHLAGALERPSQDVARVADIRVSVRRPDIADHAGRRSLLRAPRDRLERRSVGHGDHVRLLDVLVAGDRRPVKAHPAIQRIL